MIRNRRAVLALLTGLHFLNYIDRYIMPAVLKPMMDDLALSNFEAGLLSSAFLVGYFLTAPWFGARADKGGRTGLIAIGVAVWSLATVASGLSVGFWSLLVARTVVGVGEASYVALAPTIIDDITPHDRKGKALAIFYLAQPLGSALGFVLGGQIAGHSAAHAGWRNAFFFTGGPGILLALSCLLIAEPPRKLLDARARLIDGLREMARIPLFRRSVLGYIAFVAAVGAFSYWGPTFLVDHFPDLIAAQAGDHATAVAKATAKASTGVGGVLIVAGAIATFVGGWWTDRTLRRLPAAAPGAPYDAIEHRVAVNALLRICALGMMIAAPAAALCFFAPSSTAFFALAFVCDLGLFLSTSPLNVAMLRAVPAERRASAVAASVFAIHAFGDLWSPPLLGLLMDALPITVAMMTLPVTFALAAYLWWPRRREAA